MGETLPNMIRYRKLFEWMAK